MRGCCRCPVLECWCSPSGVPSSTHSTGGNQSGSGTYTPSLNKFPFPFRLHAELKDFYQHDADKAKLEHEVAKALKAMPIQQSPIRLQVDEDSPDIFGDLLGDAPLEADTLGVKRAARHKVDSTLCRSRMSCYAIFALPLAETCTCLVLETSYNRFFLHRLGSEPVHKKCKNCNQRDLHVVITSPHYNCPHANSKQVTANSVFGAIIECHLNTRRLSSLRRPIAWPIHWAKQQPSLEMLSLEASKSSLGTMLYMKRVAGIRKAHLRLPMEWSSNKVYHLEIPNTHSIPFTYQPASVWPLQQVRSSDEVIPTCNTTVPLISPVQHVYPCSVFCLSQFETLNEP